MEDGYITKRELEEFRRSIETEHKRIDEENERQNHRIAMLEESIKQMTSINISVEKLALNMENMLKEQVAQGKRLENLEKRDGEMWRKVVTYTLTTVIGIILGFVATHLGI